MHYEKNRMKKKILLLLFISDAKLRRLGADSKKMRQIFFNLCGQTFHLWTNRGNGLKCCPNLNKKGPPLRA